MDPTVALFLGTYVDPFGVDFSYERGTPVRRGTLERECARPRGKDREKERVRETERESQRGRECDRER